MVVEQKQHIDICKHATEKKSKNDKIAKETRQNQSVEADWDIWIVVRYKTRNMWIDYCPKSSTTVLHIFMAS